MDNMFYLLEDNRIIDTSKALHNVDEIIIEENENEKYLYLVGWLGKHFCGKIKKQSENVWDLIEVGDLVGDYDYFRGIVTKIDKLDNGAIYLQVNNEYYYRTEDFNKFYKRNEKDGYDLVWVEKDE